jgi:hypothetical protein
MRLRTPRFKQPFSEPLHCRDPELIDTDAQVSRNIAPRVKRVGLIFGSTELSATGEKFYHALERVAPQLSVELTPIRVRGARR